MAAQTLALAAVSANARDLQRGVPIDDGATRAPRQLDELGSREREPLAEEPIRERHAVQDLAARRIHDAEGGRPVEADALKQPTVNMNEPLGETRGPADGLKNDGDGRSTTRLRNRSHAGGSHPGRRADRTGEDNGHGHRGSG